MKENNAIAEYRYKNLCKAADEALLKSRQLDDESKKQLSLFIKFTNEAVSMICPFEIGDVIEFQERFGYKEKTRTVRMKIQRFMFSHNGYIIDGRQVNQKGELSYSKSLAVRGDDVKNPPAKLIQKAEKKEE